MGTAGGGATGNGANIGGGGGAMSGADGGTGLVIGWPPNANATGSPPGPGMGRSREPG
jgi:hypothetical protein